MGEVYLAEDTKLDRKVAIKILPATLAGNSDRMRRFVQEAKAASALNHPNIITIYEIDETESGHFLATEFIDGATLRERIRKASIKPGEVLDVAAQIASALSAAHAAGIVHRDIKPENIMMRADGIVKVLDFGLAKLTERLPPDSVDAEAATKALVQTEPGVVLGTTAYMSPEQARGLAVDARTDIFSLGVVIYELVAGRTPFGSATRSDLIAALLVLMIGAVGLSIYLHARNSGTAIESIAVLPFVNQNNDPDSEYLSDGVTESIINSLAQLPNLKVIARSSVFRYKGRQIDLIAAGKELGVRAILTGRVVQRGDNLIISTELVDVGENKQLWGEQYDRKVSDILVVQKEMAKKAWAS